MVYTRYAKQRILHLHFKENHRAPTIAKALLEERIITGRRGVAKFLLRYKSTGTILRHPGSGRWSKITQEVKELMEAQMRLDDETTELHIPNFSPTRANTYTLYTYTIPAPICTPPDSVSLVSLARQLHPLLFSIIKL